MVAIRGRPGYLLIDLMGRRHSTSVEVGSIASAIHCLYRSGNCSPVGGQRDRLDAVKEHVRVTLQGVQVEVEPVQVGDQFA